MNDYSWADYELVACISVAVTTSTDEAVRALDPGATEVRSFDEAQDAAWSSGDMCHTMTLQTDRHVILWEDNGYHGVTEESFLRLCEIGRAGSMFVNVNAVSRLMLGERGRIVREFDPLFREETDDGEGSPLPAEATLDWGRDRYLASSLLLIADYTGLPEPYDREWFFESPRARHWLLHY